MIREWTLQRGPVDGDAILGTLTTEGPEKYASLERVGVAIPEGRHPLHLTVSARAREGLLWAPRPDCKLPEITVAGRTGIRIHALNEAQQSEGCIGAGFTHTETTIGQSRPAVSAIVAALEMAEGLGDQVYLTVRDAS
jgi:hypothetical protein